MAKADWPRDARDVGPFDSQLKCCTYNPFLPNFTVAKLIHGFETPFGMELLATVHWVSTREGAKSEEETVQHTYRWNERKKGFDRKQIALARKILVNQDWLV